MRKSSLVLSLALVFSALGCGPSQKYPGSVSSLKSTPMLSETEIIELAADQNFPVHPDIELTPGLLCQDPDSHRYPEQINYCERNVSTSLKNRVIRDYDSKLGFDIGDLDRDSFKIDHYIPLCMGGDNAQSNLWPQHESVYAHTDLLEMQLCLALERGLLTQNETVDQITTAKNHLDDAAAMLEALDELLH